MDDILDISGISHDSDEEHYTSAQVLQKLQEAWINERLSPNLMECKSEIVECIMEQMQEMEENIARAKKGDLKISLHRLELDRIRYMVSSYLRCRLEKIEKYAPALLEEEKTRGEGDSSKLSPAEFAFAKEFASNVEAHLKLVALKHMPRNLQALNLHQTVAPPNLDHYIFLQVNRREEGVIVDSDDKIDLEIGAQHLVRYRPIEEFVQNGTVSLM